MIQRLTLIVIWRKFLEESEHLITKLDDFYLAIWDNGHF